MGYESGSPSQDGRDEDDEEEYEEAGGGNRFLGFMFGNVDNSGDLDVDYLDEDAKEHLAALADKLGPSLTDIDLSVKSPRTPADAAEQDYDEKAEDAVDYEDIDEQYEGPEIQATTEEDHLLPKKEYFSAEVPLAALKPTSIFDDENYDEELELEHEIVDNNVQIQTISGELGESSTVVSKGEKSLEGNLQVGSPEAENVVVDVEEDQQEVPQGPERSLDEKDSTPLPVLCIENGKVILRFSEIFGIHETLKKVEKRDHRYSIPKDRFKYMDISDIVEEDEEAFLKDAGQGYSFLKQAHEIEHSLSAPHDDGPEVATFGFLQGAASLTSENNEQRKDSAHSVEPMKGVVGYVSAKVQSAICPGFYPIDQQDWEERIIWDSSPVASGNSVESCEISGPGLEALVVSETEQETVTKDPESEPPVGPNENDHRHFLCRSPNLLEPLGSRNSLGHTDLPFSFSRYHPQLLRLESRQEEEVSSHADGRRVNGDEELHQSDGLRHFSKLTSHRPASQYREMMDGSWLDKIIWETDGPIEKPKLILDLQDEQMLFEILDSKDSKHLGLHAGAMILTRSIKSRNGDSLEQLGHGGQSGWRSVANDKHYSNRKSSQKIKSNSEKRTAHGVKVFHSQPAVMLQTMKLKLSNKELGNFHRPKALWYPHDNQVAVKEQGKLPNQGPMKIVVKSLGGKGSKLHVDAEETISSIKTKASKKLDFKLSEMVRLFYLGKELEDNSSLASQNVQPNSLLHLVRTRIHLLPRAQKLPSENKSLRPPGAFKKKSELSAKDGHVFLMEYCEERPLLLGNIGMGARLCTYYQKCAPDDQTGSMLRNGNSSLGHVIVLDPADKSPFLGDIKPGSNQSSVETNMYRAPIFPHKVPSTDYLLVRSAKGKLSIRRIDKIDVVGQQEPLMEVISPGSKALQTYMTNRLLVHMAREFRTAEKRHLPPRIRADELPGQFPFLSETIIRKKLKEHANLQRGPNGQWIWVKKRNFRIWSEDELREKVKPEDVCAYESMQAGIYHLKHLGISGVLPTSISSAMSRLPDEAIILAAASHIERELQITPWNLSSNFFNCVIQGKENIERMEITGVGDPSGRGLGFSYVRNTLKAPMSSAMMKKKTATVRGGPTVTGTDADLRRLSMEAAREVLLKFDVGEEEIAKLTRWHRIAMIRKLSSEQAASGVQIDPTTISKYARGQRMSFLQLQQQTREKCQEIWDRQVQSLSALDHENESDSEGNSDLDSFAGDLENLLDAEECEEEVGNCGTKYEKGDGVKGLKMRRRPSLAQAEEEIEDEAAEAAELCRLLMDGDDAERRKKKKTGVVREQSRLAGGSQPSFGIENVDRIKKIIGNAQPDGSYTSKEYFSKDKKEVENVLAKRSKYGKVKATKKPDITNIGLVSKKLKISGDKVKVFKEKKSARESFVCGACGQLGHMRTNKNCPKYGEDLEANLETADLEKASIKLKSLDPSSQSQQKPQIKKLIPKSVTKIAIVEAPDDEKASLKAKVLPVKFKCGSVDKLSDNLGVEAALGSDQPVTSISETGKSIVKFNKIIIPSKMKADDADPPKPSIVIRPPTNTAKDQPESHRRSLVIRPQTETDRDQPQKKIIIKRPKEIIDVDQVSQDGSTGFEYRKTKRIVELSKIEKHKKHENMFLAGESAKKKAREDRRWWEEQEKQRNEERLREERTRRLYEGEMRMLEEQEKLAEIKRYEASIRREREEEEREKAKKKKKKKRPEVKEEYLEDPRTRRNDKRMPDRDRSAKRRPVVELGRYSAEYTPQTKRRKGGEVGLANILERMVETLKDKYEVSYLFLKPVSKKDAPDYHDIIKRPMDLATIKEKVRKMEYKSREDFRHDVWQITYNAHIYNDGRNPGIPPLADQLLELCDYLLIENDESLTEAEAGIEYRE